MPGAASIKKSRKAYKDSQTKRNMKNAKPRPQQKQKPKKKSFVSKIKDKIFGTKKAKAGTIKRKDKPKMQEGMAYEPKRTSNRQPGIKKANERKESSRDYVKRHAGVTGKMPKAKDSQVMKAEADRRKRAKSKKAKQDSAAIMKAERANRAKSKKSIADKKAADNRDAKRGGFISANAMRSSAKKANKAQADRKKKKSDELISRGRR
jgi:hypothetical protein